MKKLIALFITTAVMVTALTACGGGSSESKSDSTSEVSADNSSSAVETTAEEAGSHIFTLDTNDGFIMTMEYPDRFQYQDEWSSISFRDAAAKRYGALLNMPKNSSDITVFAFAYCKARDGVDKLFDTLRRGYNPKVFVNFEEIDGYPAIFSARNDYPIDIFIKLAHCKMRLQQ